LKFAFPRRPEVAIDSAQVTARLKAARFRMSFFGPGYPAQVPHVAITLREYRIAFAHGSYGLGSDVALWLLLAILAWKQRPTRLPMIVACAAAAHFLLHPSAEDRYLVWAHNVVGAALIATCGRIEPGTQSKLMAELLGW
jgi:hypothetical protein